MTSSLLAAERNWTARAAKRRRPGNWRGGLQREIETREQVIGELTIANRILKKLSGPSL